MLLNLTKTAQFCFRSEKKGKHPTLKDHLDIVWFLGQVPILVNPHPTSCDLGEQKGDLFTSGHNP